MDIQVIQLLQVSQECIENGTCTYQDLYNLGFNYSFTIFYYLIPILFVISGLMRIIKDAGDD